MTVVDRFLKYVTFATQSDEESGITPSTSGQRVFAEALVKNWKPWAWKRFPWMIIRI